MFDALHPRRFGSENPEAVGFGLLFAGLGAVHLWTLLVGYGLTRLGSAIPGGPASPFVLGSAATYVVGFGLPALLYVRLRPLDVPFGRPGDRRGAFAAVATPLGLVAAAAVGAHAVLGLSVATLEQTTYRPGLGPGFLVRTTVLPAGFAALGTGLLLFGAVQTRLRDLTTPAVAVVATPLVAGVFYYLPMELLPTGSPDRVTAALVVVVVFAGVGIGLALGLLSRGVVRDGMDAVLRPAYAPVFLVGLLGLLGVVQTMLADFPQVIAGLTWLVVVAVAASAYERTRSIWPPVAALFVYRTALGVAIYLEVQSGLAPLP